MKPEKEKTKDISESPSIADFLKIIRKLDKEVGSEETMKRVKKINVKFDENCWIDNGVWFSRPSGSNGLTFNHDIYKLALLYAQEESY